MTEETLNNRCVYTHKDINGTIRYIGSGTLKRAKSNHPKSDRGRLYEDFVTKNGRLIVEIVQYDLNQLDARNLEIILYEKHYPFGNLLNSRKPYKVKTEISKDELNNIIYYDESSPSCLRWKTYRSSNAPVGGVAGGLNLQGYYTVSINRKRYYAHRLVVLLAGITLFEHNVIDHINGNKSDNRIENLLVTDQNGNSKNRAKPKNNSTGVTGVFYDKRRDQYIAMALHPITKLYSTKHFLISKYGDDALTIAKEAREDMIRSFNLEFGDIYSERHGL